MISCLKPLVLKWHGRKLNTNTALDKWQPKTIFIVWYPLPGAHKIQVNLSFLHSHAQRFLPLIDSSLVTTKRQGKCKNINYQLHLNLNKWPILFLHLFLFLHFFLQVLRGYKIQKRIEISIVPFRIYFVIKCSFF